MAVCKKEERMWSVSRCMLVRICYIWVLGNMDFLGRKQRCWKVISYFSGLRNSELTLSLGSCTFIFTTLLCQRCLVNNLNQWLVLSPFCSCFCWLLHNIAPLTVQRACNIFSIEGYIHITRSRLEWRKWCSKVEL